MDELLLGLEAVWARLSSVDASWNRVVKTVQPRAELRALYDRLYSVYRELYDVTRDLAHNLAELQLTASPTAPDQSGAEATIAAADPA